MSSWDSGLLISAGFPTRSLHEPGLPAVPFWALISSSVEGGKSHAQTAGGKRGRPAGKTQELCQQKRASSWVPGPHSQIFTFTSAHSRPVYSPVDTGEALGCCYYDNRRPTPLIVPASSGGCLGSAGTRGPLWGPSAVEGILTVRCSRPGLVTKAEETEPWSRLYLSSRPREVPGEAAGEY